MQIGGSQLLIDSFYNLYRTKNKRYNNFHLNNWMLIYRYFKECRNCVMHNGGQCTPTIIDAYENVKNLTNKDIDTKEVPCIIAPELSKPLHLSLRGVVGFSQIVIKIVSTFDVEMIKCKGAEEYFCEQISDNMCETSPYDRLVCGRQKLIKRIMGKAYFNMPEDYESVYKILVNKGMLRS